MLVPPPELLTLLVDATRSSFGADVSQEDVRHFVQTKADPQSGPIPKHFPSERKVFGWLIEVDVNASGSMNGAKPRSFSIGGESRLVKSWKGMLLDVCAIVAAQNAKNFEAVVNHIRGKRRSYFAYKSSNLTDGRQIRGTNIFVEVNLSANNIKSLCDALSRYFGYGSEIPMQFWNV